MLYVNKIDLTPSLQNRLDPFATDLFAYAKSNSLMALSLVFLAISSKLQPLRSAMNWASRRTLAGSLRLPLKPSGDRYGQSVSSNNLSMGTYFTTSRKVSDFL